jgi:hypothetical protein
MGAWALSIPAIFVLWCLGRFLLLLAPGKVWGVLDTPGLERTLRLGMKGLRKADVLIRGCWVGGMYIAVVLYMDNDDVFVRDDFG